MAKYVKNKDLLVEMKKYRESGEISEELGRMYMLIASNLSNKSNFIGYTWREEMVADAVLTCCKYGKNFDPEKGKNPFAYITRICYNAMVTYIKKQNRHGTIKQSLYDNKDLVDEDTFFSYSSTHPITSCDNFMSLIK